MSYDEGANNPQAYHGGGASVNVAYDFGGVTLTSITALETISGYSRGDTDAGSGTVVAQPDRAVGLYPDQANPKATSRAWTRCRKNCAWPAMAQGPFKWQVGALEFTSDDTTDFFQRGYFLLPTATGYNPNNWVELKDHNTSWAVFGQASYKITPDFTITFGARETNDSKETTLEKPPETAAGVSTFPTTAAVQCQAVRPKSPASTWLPTIRSSPNVSVYARVATGFRGPTIQGRSAVFSSAFTTAHSETIVSEEVGHEERTVRPHAASERRCLRL